MNVYTYEVKGAHTEIVEVTARTQPQAEKKLKSAVLNGKPLVINGFKLLKKVKENN